MVSILQNFLHIFNNRRADRDHAAAVRPREAAGGDRQDGADRRCGDQLGASEGRLHQVRTGGGPSGRVLQYCHQSAQRVFLIYRQRILLNLKLKRSYLVYKRYMYIKRTFFRFMMKLSKSKIFFL